MENIVENNKLLAEFLGYKIWSWDNENFYITKGATPNNETNYNIKRLKFDYDWNWLMEVVEKIEELEGFIVHINSFSTSYVYLKVECNRRFFHHKKYFSKGGKIEATYIACVEFVKWYNQNK